MTGFSALLQRRPVARLRTVLVLLTALVAVSLYRTATAADLTQLSLEALMEVELPPVSHSARFQVSATAVESCVISATDLAFGIYDPMQATPTEGTSLVIVRCTVDTAYTVGLDAGTAPGATTATRSLTGAMHTLRYGLYRDPNRALSWGDSEGTDTIEGHGTGLPSDYVVYGRIPPGQPVRRGNYVDTITVTVTY